MMQHGACSDEAKWFVGELKGEWQRVINFVDDRLRKAFPEGVRKCGGTVTLQFPRPGSREDLRGDEHKEVHVQCLYGGEIHLQQLCAIPYPRGSTCGTARRDEYGRTLMGSHAQSKTTLCECTGDMCMRGAPALAEYKDAVGLLIGAGLLRSNGLRVRLPDLFKYAIEFPTLKDEVKEAMWKVVKLFHHDCHEHVEESLLGAVGVGMSYFQDGVTMRKALLEFQLCSLE